MRKSNNLLTFLVNNQKINKQTKENISSWDSFTILEKSTPFNCNCPVNQLLLRCWWPIRFNTILNRKIVNITAISYILGFSFVVMNISQITNLNNSILDDESVLMLIRLLCGLIYELQKKWKCQLESDGRKSGAL